MIANFSLFILLQAKQSWLLMSDKIYSVLAILLIVFGLLSIYMVSTNRKISDLEQKMDELEKES